MEKHYKVTKSWVKGTKNGKFIGPFIPKNSAIVVISEKNGYVTYYHQGHSKCKMDCETFNDIPKIETKYTEEFIYDYIIPNEKIIKVYELLSVLLKKYSKNPLIEKSLRTSKTWISQSKGSSAISGSQYENLDFNDLEWEKYNGFKSKPFHYYENRSGRTTVTPTLNEINLWMDNPKDVLPIGIKKNEQCSYSEMYKIAVKIIQQLCGMRGIEDEFKNIVIDFIPEIDKNYEHYDYMTGERIDISMFEHNTHHGKKKGLELCHIDPNLDSATIADNITIGFSSSNRKQSGNSIEDMALNGTNAILIQHGLPPMDMGDYLSKILPQIY